MRAVPRLCKFYPGICLTTEEKARKNLSQSKKNLSQSTVYILPKHPHITKPSQTHTLQKPHIHTHYKNHTYTHITKTTHTHTHTPHIHTHYKNHTYTHITKTTHTHTLQKPQIHTHYKNHTYTLQNNIKPPGNIFDCSVSGGPEAAPQQTTQTHT